MTDELKPPVEGATEDSTVEPIVETVVEEVVTLSKAEAEELRKKAEIAENYKRENEKYRQMEKEGRLNSIKTEEVDLSDTIPILFEKDKQEVLDTVVQEFSESASDEQWGKFKSLFPSIDTLKQEAILSGKPISRAKIEQRIKSFIDYAKGGQTSTEKARAEGAAEVLKATAADIGTMGGTKKQVSAGITQEDLEYSEASNGQITPERAKEIRENRERRSKEW